jgi:hypothetical protein
MYARGIHADALCVANGTMMPTGHLQCCRQEQQAAERRALLAGSTAREDVDGSAVALNQVRQGRRGVEEMLEQATHVLTGIGATREALKVSSPL